MNIYKVSFSKGLGFIAETINISTKEEVPFPICQNIEVADCDDGYASLDSDFIKFLETCLNRFELEHFNYIHDIEYVKIEPLFPLIEF